MAETIELRPRLAVNEHDLRDRLSASTRNLVVGVFVEGVFHAGIAIRPAWLDEDGVCHEEPGVPEFARQRVLVLGLPPSVGQSWELTFTPISKPV